MRTDFTSIQMALSNLVSALHETRQELFKQANVERENLLAAYRNLTENHLDLVELTALADSTADTLAFFADATDDTAEVISDVICGGDVPTCAFEDFIGFCDDCGATIKRGEKYQVDGDWYVCENCLPAEEPEDTETEGETEDGEQLTIDLAETVTENA